MATLKQRLHRKNSSGTYDVIHLETSADCITGTLAIANGGTGATTAANARTNLGAAASSHNHSTANITSGTLSVARGGTGRASWTANRLVYASASTTLNQLAFPTTAGSVLRQGTSGAPYWSTPDQLFSNMDGVKFEIITKIGDGEITSSTTFSGDPILWWVAQEPSRITSFWCGKVSGTDIWTSNSSYNTIDLSWSGNTVTYCYSDARDGALWNRQGTTYYFYCIYH